MNKYIPIILLLLVAAAIILYLPSTAEQTISVADFQKEFNTTSSIAIVMDMRSSQSDAVMQCGVDIAMRLGEIGKYNTLKNQTFVYEGDHCIGTSNYSVEQCESSLSNSLVFYISYNPSQNSTSFYKSKVVTQGDDSFLSDCQISKII